MPPGVTSTELVVVRLQQGLGNVPLLTAGQLLTRALLLLAAAAGQVGIALREGEAGMVSSDWTAPRGLVSPAPP